MTKLSVNDRLAINDEYVGFLKSRNGKHVNSPSARSGQTTVFYENDHANKAFGKAHEIDMPAMVHTADHSEKVNPAVVSEIKKILAQ